MHVCALADLPRGTARRLPTTPPVSVFHTADGGLYAVDDTCTHQDASLADGWVEDCWVECPLHAAVFDLRTGESDGLLARRPLRTHTVHVVDGAVHVELSVGALAP
jgi:3-phenylpropionate/trans-cinnamate dioxygenase ferredoxin component